MDQTELLQQLKDFLQNEPACVETLACLKPGAEVQISVAETLHIAVSYGNNEVQILEEESSKADFIFHSSPSAIETLINQKGLTPAQLGIQFLKQIVAQEIKVSMPVSVFHISRKGYLDILKVGGMEFLNELKKMGLTNIPKILTALKKLRR
ncbi:MAG: hypothetical protein HRT44_04960 [Bdellovibrionales bacterium]|nr:hypothetical protein [Bdellovibrionales bacterium]NQZ18591.1 hypothetical protein [Bdellovibrionales bacterium]